MRENDNFMKLKLITTALLYIAAVTTYAQNNVDIPEPDFNTPDVFPCEESIIETAFSYTCGASYINVYLSHFHNQTSSISWQLTNEQNEKKLEGKESLSKVFSINLTELPTGSYSLTVTQFPSGCSKSISLQWKKPIPLEMEALVEKNISCEEAAKVLIKAKGGMESYEFRYEKADEKPTSSCSDLSPQRPYTNNPYKHCWQPLHSPQHIYVDGGTWIFYIRDKAGCVQSATITIEPYQNIKVGSINTHYSSAECSEGKEGKLHISAYISGGIAPYQYVISNISSPTSTPMVVSVTNGEATIENVNSGTYRIDVKDSKGCTAVATVTTLYKVSPITAAIDYNHSIFYTCNGEKTGSVVLHNITGGSGLYRAYLIYSDKKTVIDRKTNVKAGDIVVFAGIAPSNGRFYEIVLQDSKGCLFTKLSPFDIYEHNNLLLDYIDREVVCDTQTQSGYKDYLVVKFKNQTVDFSKISYTFNKGHKPQSFTRTIGNIAYIEDFDRNTTYTQTIEISYNTTSAELSSCPPPSMPFKLNKWDGFTLERVRNDQLNTIEVLAKGGIISHPNDYVYYFNGVSQRKPIYKLKYSDPEVTRDGQTYKVVEVKAEDAKGCFRSLLIEVPYIDIEIPNFFTPNGDGNNDYWKAKNIENFPRSLTYIYDRKGQKMAVLNPNQEWNGIFNGQQMPSGDYWYIIELNDALSRDLRKFSGHFTLYR